MANTISALGALSSLGGPSIEVNFSLNAKDCCNNCCNTTKKLDQRKIVANNKGVLSDDKISSWRCCISQKEERNRENRGLTCYQAYLIQTYGAVAAKASALMVGVNFSERQKDHNFLRLDEALAIQEKAKQLKEGQLDLRRQAEQLQQYATSQRKDTIAEASEPIFHFDYDDDEGEQLAKSIHVKEMDGRVTEFSSDKIRNAIKNIPKPQGSSSKETLSDEQIEQVVRNVRNEILNSGKKEVTKREIRTSIVHELAKIHVTISPPNLYKYLVRKDFIDLLAERDSFDDLNDQELTELCQAWIKAKKAGDSPELSTRSLVKTEEKS